MTIANRITRRSLCLNVEGFLRHNRYPKGYNVFEHDDGTEMSPAEALAFLTTEKAKGHVVIPCSARCNNPCAEPECKGFDYSGGGCPGSVVIDPSDSGSVGKGCDQC